MVKIGLSFLLWTAFLATSLSIRLSLLGEAFNVFNHTNVFSVNTQQYTYTGPGTGVCNGHANGCLAPVASFRTPSATNNNLFGARQSPDASRSRGCGADPLDPPFGGRAAGRPGGRPRDEGVRSTPRLQR